MPFSQSNKFLNELLAAMESSGGEPSIEEVQNGPLGSEAMGRDPSGNPDGPGDPESTPDPDGSVVPKPNPEDPMANANCPSGNPDGPGDPQADPAVEGFMDSFRKWRGKRNLAAELRKKSISELLPDWEKAAFNNSGYMFGDEAKNILVSDCAGPNGGIFKAYKMSTNLPEEVTSIELKLKRVQGPNNMVLWYGIYDGGELLTDDKSDIWVVRTDNLRHKPVTNTVDVFEMANDIAKAVAYSDGDVASATATEADVTVPEPIDFNSIPSGSAIPASAVGKFDEFLKNVSTEKSTHLIEIEGQKDGYDASGNSGSPGEQGDPVNTDGEPKKAPAEPQTTKANDPSGNPGSPGVNGDPVSKSGAPVPQSKTEAERTADDPSGNPDSPGVDGDPDPGFESFIAVCEQAMVTRKPGTVFIPKGMSLESYAMQIGLGEITARALEADLSEAERNKLPNSAFGLPKERKWPLNDESHVRQAIRYFARCPAEQQRELAKNILKAMRKFGMNDVKVGKNNPFRKYCPDVAVG